MIFISIKTVTKYKPIKMLLSNLMLPQKWKLNKLNHKMHLSNLMLPPKWKLRKSNHKMKDNTPIISQEKNDKMRNNTTKISWSQIINRKIIKVINLE